MVTANVTLKYLKRSLAPINAKRVLVPIFFVMNSLINKTTPYLWKNELHINFFTYQVTMLRGLTERNTATSKVRSSLITDVSFSC